MDEMVALVLIIALVVLTALAVSYGSDSRDYEPRNALGDPR